MPIHVELSNEDLWNKFSPNIEMITTREGRQLFPHLNYKISGLENDTMYSVSMHFEQVGEKRLFIKGKWQEYSGHPTKIHTPSEPVKHGGSVRCPGSLQKGEYWMSETVSFSTIKITNNPEKTGCMLVNSLHKYQPVLTITRFGEEKGEEFRLKITEFIAVTAYNDKRIIQLKCEYNKFALRRREFGKRKATSSELEEPSELEEDGNKKMKMTSSQQNHQKSQVSSESSLNPHVSNQSFNSNSHASHSGMMPSGWPSDTLNTFGNQLQMNQPFPNPHQMHQNPFFNQHPTLTPLTSSGGAPEGYNWNEDYQNPPNIGLHNQMLPLHQYPMYQQPTSSGMPSGFWNPGYQNPAPQPSFQHNHQVFWNQNLNPYHQQYNDPMAQFNPQSHPKF